MEVYWTDGDVWANCSRRSSRSVLRSSACSKVEKECDGTDDRVGTSVNESEREAELPDHRGSGRECGMYQRSVLHLKDCERCRAGQDSGLGAGIEDHIYSRGLWCVPMGVSVSFAMDLKKVSFTRSGLYHPSWDQSLT